MLLLVIFFALIAISGIICKRTDDCSIIQLITILLIIGYTIGCFFIIIGTLDAQIYADIKYEQAYQQYEMLNRAIMSGNTSGNVIHDAIEYNQNVLEYRQFYNNIWIGSLYFRGCETLPLIEMP